jgi:hypothetical protein
MQQDYLRKAARQPVRRCESTGSNLSISNYSRPSLSLNEYIIRWFAVASVTLETQMPSPSSRPRNVRSLSLGSAELKDLLELFLAMDQGIVEYTMSFYNLPRRDRIKMRKQNRRLHHALREGLPLLLQSSRNVVQTPGL